MSGDDIVERLKARTCPAGEPWTADDPSTDHGHTDYTPLGVRAGTNACRLGDCWLYWLATNEIERLRADLAAERALANQLADALSDETRNGPLRAGGVAALAAWQEARREQ